jgi:tellurite resistance protein
MATAFSAQDALAATMILTAAADVRLPAVETATVSAAIDRLPSFAGFDRARLGAIDALVGAALAETEGLDRLLAEVAAALPPRLAETAYALACDVAAADLNVPPEEVRFLELLRDRLGLDRLTAAAIERGARARYARAETGR